MEENPEPTIVEASYHEETGFELLHLKLSDGRRLLIPKEDLPELKNATAEQAKDIWLTAPYVAVWWPQVDDGLYLPDFLERRWVRLGAESRPRGIGIVSHCTRYPKRANGVRSAGDSHVSKARHGAAKVVAGCGPIAFHFNFAQRDT
jgi:hypothetical protein